MSGERIGYIDGVRVHDWAYYQRYEGFIYVYNLVSALRVDMSLKYISQLVFFSSLLLPHIHLLFLLLWLIFRFFLVIA